MSIAIGDPAPAFELPATDGGWVALADLEAPAVLVAFWCNHCPYVRAWEERFEGIAREYAPRGVASVAICANDPVSYPGDSFEAMAERARERGYPFPYVQDESQRVARAYGAERTPEVFLLDAERRVVYHGAIDDDHSHPDSVGTAYLRDALEALLAGQAAPVAETRPVGCTIKWRRG